MLVFSNIKVHAQDFKVVTKTAEIVDNKVIVKYDFETDRQNQQFKVWIEIKNSSGKKIQFNSISGDAGENIKAGKNKTIVWNFLNDEILINDEIGIEVMAKLVNIESVAIDESETKDDIADNNTEINKPQKKVSAGQTLILSSVLPGLGITKVNQKKYYLALSVITYGSVAMSYFYNNQSYKNYNEYLNGGTISSRSDFFKSSKSQKTMSNVFIYTAAATWTANMIWTYIATSKDNKSVAGTEKKNNFNFTININSYNKKPEFGIGYRF